MEQSEFELRLLKQLVIPKGKNELGIPQWQAYDFLFYDKLDFFNCLTKEEYTDFVLAMIIQGLLSYNKHGYQENHRERWTIKITPIGFKKLELVDKISTN